MKFHLLAFFTANTLRALIVADEDSNAEKKEIVNFCFNASLQGTLTCCESPNICPLRSGFFEHTSWRYLYYVGYRLNVTILMTKVVHDWLGCVLECVTQPCCRSINYKKTLNLQNESNCEMLHNMVYNTSRKFLERNCSYDHVYLNNPQKVQVIHNSKLDIFAQVII